MTPDILTQLLNQILGCACECLNTFGSCPCPCRTFITAGPLAWDLSSCCSDGALVIGVDRIYVHGNFPAEQGGVNTCLAPLAADITMKLLRCFPGLHDDGSDPTADELGAASEKIYQDLYVVTHCVICNLSSRGRYQKFVWRGGQILGPQGGCIGAEWKFTIELPDPLP